MLDFHTREPGAGYTGGAAAPDFPISIVRRANAALRAAAGQRAEN